MPRIKRRKKECNCFQLMDRGPCLVHGGKVKVIRDVADGNFDYYLPAREAQRLYREGKLALDVINNCYCTVSETPWINSQKTNQ
jgi:hypothetical protein